MTIVPLHRLDALLIFRKNVAGTSKIRSNRNRDIMEEGKKDKNLCLRHGETENVAVCGVSSSQREKRQASEILMSLSEKASSDININDASEKMKAKNPTNSSFNFDSILENMANSWRELGLGVTTGSVALNEYLQRMEKTSQNSHLSAQETLYLISTLRAKTWHPPRNSPLNRLLPLHPSHSETSPVSEKAEDPKWMRTLSKLYVAMVAQDADDGTLYRNNLLNNYTSFEIASLLRSFENRITDLAIREDSVRLRAQQELNLIPCVTIPHYVEYIHHPLKVDDDNA